MQVAIRGMLLGSLGSMVTIGWAGEVPHCIAVMKDETCRPVATLAGSGDVCQWSFAYRAPDAVAGFERLTDNVRSCLGADTERGADTPVNHPDSYDLRQFVAGGTLISVSLKDKAALRRTLVFLRIEPDPAK